MCGRFAITKTIKELSNVYNARGENGISFESSYNLCPTEIAPIVVGNADEERALRLGRFGIPMQIQGKKFPLLNLQSEKIANRKDFETRRCVIPASGFF